MYVATKSYSPPSLSLTLWICTFLALLWPVLSLYLFSGLSDLRNILFGGEGSAVSRIFSCLWSPLLGWLFDEYLSACKTSPPQKKERKNLNFKRNFLNSFYRKIWCFNFIKFYEFVSVKLKFPLQLWLLFRQDLYKCLTYYKAPQTNHNTVC